MFANPLEKMAEAEVTKIETKLKAIDANHDGLPDLAQAQKLFASGFAALKALETKIPPSAVAKFLETAFPTIFNTADITAAETAFGEVAQGVTILEALAKVVPTVI